MTDCFVIMPMTNPAHLTGDYGHDVDHFPHVLEHLFQPAIKGAGYEPIPPSAGGADLIHAEIIRRIELADLVLCDMSALNPNVFFELGIRTAVDKPICLVRDLLTHQVPFDTGIINYHTYDPSLVPWRLDDQVKSLTSHLTESLENSNGRNPLWKYFGLTKRSEMGSSDSPIEDKLDLLLSRVDSIEESRRYEPSLTEPTVGPRAIREASRQANLVAFVGAEGMRMARESGMSIRSHTYFDARIVEFKLGLGRRSPRLMDQISSMGAAHGVQVRFITAGDGSTEDDDRADLPGESPRRP